jgi:hypothetical protein
LSSKPSATERVELTDVAKMKLAILTIIVAVGIFSCGVPENPGSTDSATTTSQKIENAQLISVHLNDGRVTLKLTSDEDEIKKSSLQLKCNSAIETFEVDFVYYPHASCEISLLSFEINGVRFESQETAASIQFQTSEIENPSVLLLSPSEEVIVYGSVKGSELYLATAGAKAGVVVSEFGFKIGGLQNVGSQSAKPPSNGGAFSAEGFKGFSESDGPVEFSLDSDAEELKIAVEGGGVCTQNAGCDTEFGDSCEAKFRGGIDIGLEFVGFIGDGEAWGGQLSHQSFGQSYYYKYLSYIRSDGYPGSVSHMKGVRYRMKRTEPVENSFVDAPAGLESGYNRLYAMSSLNQLPNYTYPPQPFKRLFINIPFKNSKIGSCNTGGPRGFGTCFSGIPAKEAPSFSMTPVTSNSMKPIDKVETKRVRVVQNGSTVFDSSLVIANTVLKQTLAGSDPSFQGIHVPLYTLNSDGDIVPHSIDFKPGDEVFIDVWLSLEVFAKDPLVGADSPMEHGFRIFDQTTPTFNFSSELVMKQSNAFTEVFEGAYVKLVPLPTESAQGGYLVASGFHPSVDSYELKFDRHQRLLLPSHPFIVNSDLDDEAWEVKQFDRQRIHLNGPKDLGATQTNEIRIDFYRYMPNIYLRFYSSTLNRMVTATYAPAN